MDRLVPASKLNLAQNDHLQIVAADITDVYGRPLDGNDHGAPGGNYVAIVSKNSATPAAVKVPVTMMARAVDAVIERHESLNAATDHRGRNLARFRGR